MANERVDTLLFISTSRPVRFDYIHIGAAAHGAAGVGFKPLAQAGSAHDRVAAASEANGRAILHAGNAYGFAWACHFWSISIDDLFA